MGWCRVAPHGYDTPRGWGLGNLHSRTISPVAFIKMILPPTFHKWYRFLRWHSNPNATFLQFHIFEKLFGWRQAGKFPVNKKVSVRKIQFIFVCIKVLRIITTVISLWTHMNNHKIVYLILLHLIKIICVLRLRRYGMRRRKFKAKIRNKIFCVNNKFGWIKIETEINHRIQRLIKDITKIIKPQLAKKKINKRINNNAYL